MPGRHNSQVALCQRIEAAFRTMHTFACLTRALHLAEQVAPAEGTLRAAGVGLTYDKKETGLGPSPRCEQTRQSRLGRCHRYVCFAA